MIYLSQLITASTRLFPTHPKIFSGNFTQYYTMGTLLNCKHTTLPLFVETLYIFFFVVAYLPALPHNIFSLVYQAGLVYGAK